ncbi:DEAD/DEAH box helicase [Clostridium culturomicium]|uniref:DEAD/DEAH box helicase n=1 Tax=Clostridium culturomicium TaxID=1499683 RepID=UPI0009DCB29B|nr:DEAD/DEAH box helicase [Clostridium culturomicium]
MQFNDLNIIKPILKALKDEGYEETTAIQEKAIPKVLEGKDLLGCAQTGTGKTAAFALPILQKIYEASDNNRNIKGNRSISAVVLAPTRELAIQITESFKAYSCYMNIKTSVIYGGVSQSIQVKELEKGMDVLVATPGRLLDLINQRYVNLSNVKFLVLDEADRMLDMGMIGDVKRIISYMQRKRQNLLFSATMPKEIEELVKTILNSPVRINISPISSTVDTVVQGVYFVDQNNKLKLLLEMLKKEEIKSVLVFVRTKHGANKLKIDLSRAGIKSDALHGDRSQEAREKILKEFKTGKIQVLVATDVAARGIDIEDLKYVINYEFPSAPETYVHRIGRTGRAGSSGFAYSFCDISERDMFHVIETLIGKKIPTVLENPYPAINLTIEKKMNTRKASSGSKNSKGTAPMKKNELPKKLNQSGNAAKPKKKWDYGSTTNKGKSQRKRK